MKAIAQFVFACLCWSWTLGLTGLQAQPTDDQRRLAEFGRLSQQIMKTADPDQQIALVEQAQQVFASIRTWPANLPPREGIAPELRALLGQAYLARKTGDPVENLETAIGHLEAAVASGVRRAGQPVAWGVSQHALAFAYLSRPRGIRADNMEAAIRAAQAAVSVLTPQANPNEWAVAQITLAEALINRERGSRSENLEAALQACELVLSVMNAQSLPVVWLRAERMRAIAYYQRVHGTRGENLEKAITHGEAALAAANRINSALEAALVRNTLAAAYFDRAAGDRSDNIERAITHNLQAAKVLTREAWPHLWAAIQNNLGTNYNARIAGSRVDNIEHSIAAFEAALTVTVREAYPREWAETQHNLAQAYFWRTTGDMADNQEKAIAMMEATLPVWQSNGMTAQWARSLNNLAVAYQFRMRGERSANIERAIKANQAALTARPRDKAPIEWAESQSNLANAYMARIAGDRPDNIERSIQSYESILPVYKDAAMWRDWATAQNNLASAYSFRPRGDRGENLKRSAKAYQASLAIRTAEALPRDSVGTGRLLGEVQLLRGDWQVASEAFAVARRAFLILYGQGLQDAEARLAVAQAGTLFAGAAYAAAQRNDLTAALTLASEGRARLLATALRLQDLDLPPEKRARLETLRSGIKREEQAYEAASGPAKGPTLQRLLALRGELVELVQSAGGPGGRGDDLLARALGHIPEGGALVLPITTAVGGKLLILAHSGAGQPALTAVDIPQLTSGAVDKLLRGERGEGGWLGAFGLQYLQGEERERRTQDWLSAIDAIGGEVWRLFGGRLEAALLERGMQPGARVVWLPAGALGLLPVGLSHNPQGGSRLAELFELVTVPSLEALDQSARRLKVAAESSLAAAINPTGETPDMALPFTEIEGVLVARHFVGRPHAVLDQTNATPGAVLSALKGKTYWHFSSHGAFDWADARKTALIMRGSAPLTVGALLAEEGRLGAPRLVVLSACETGLYDVRSNPEEFVGLPATFLQLGAAGVVATLWQVDDLATALLIAKFYDLHMADKLSPPSALRGAQAWLRGATREDLVNYGRVSAAVAKLEAAKLAELEDTLSTLRRKRATRFTATWNRLQERNRSTTGSPADGAGAGGAKPFAHPYYWGGFVYTGL
jgi:CHAT domain-containing protein